MQDAPEVNGSGLSIAMPLDLVRELGQLTDAAGALRSAAGEREAAEIALKLAREITRAAWSALLLFTGPEPKTRRFVHREETLDCEAESVGHLMSSCFLRSFEPVELKRSQLGILPGWEGEDGLGLLVPILGPQRELVGILQVVRIESVEYGPKPRAMLKHLAHVFGLSLETRLALQREKECQAQLHFQIEKYRNFVQRSSEGVWRFESKIPIPVALPVDAQIHSFYEHIYLAEGNDAMARMYGFKCSDEMINLPLERFLDRQDPLNYKLLEAFILSGYKLESAESVGRDQGGQPCHFLNTFVGVIENGCFIRAWGNKLDISHHKRLQAQLSEAANDAQSANRAKSFFLANMSHEIRTPLGVILGFADLALDANGLNPETRKYITTIKRNGEQLSRILGEVLDLSKIEASRFEVECIRFSLLPLIREVTSFLELKAKEKALSLEFVLLDPLPVCIRSDPTRLRQILINLIGNAIKFTPKGRIELKVRMLSQAIPEVPVCLEFSVADSGIGISTDRRENLFQPYSQMESSTTRKYGGTGLGLMLSKQLAVALGGDLLLKESTPGKGSVFTFHINGGSFEGETLAKEGRDPGERISHRSEIAEEFRGKYVLLVEDQTDNQVLLSRYLTGMGFEVELANNGLEALEKAKERDFDLILMDIQMPGLDGHQATRELRNLGYRKPIWAITAHAFKEDRERAFASGFNEYLTKPIQRGTLLQAISRRLTMH